MANYIVINPLFTRTAQETLLVTLHIFHVIDQESMLQVNLSNISSGKCSSIRSFKTVVT